MKLNSIQTKKYSKKQIVGWILVVLGMVIAIFVRAAISGTNPFHLDNWYSTANDEMSYYRSVVVMRTYGLPQGYAGYNENIAPMPAYGSYNYFTFAVYYLLSFITGYTSHNFIVYANVILMTLAYLLFVLLVRPTFKQSMWVFAFQMTQLIVGWFTWSGMSEANSLFMVITVISLSIYIERQLDNNDVKKRTIVAYAFIVLLVCFYGVIRPFLWIYILYPVWFLYKAWKKKLMKKSTIIVMGSVSGVSLLAFMYAKSWMSAHVCTKYFSSESAAGDLIGSLKKGQIGTFFKVFFAKNVSETKLWVEALSKGKRAGVIAVETLLLLALYIVAICLKKKAKNNKNIVLLLIFAISIFAIFEANILLYTAIQFHRMLLTSVVGGTILLIMDAPEDKKIDFKVLTHQIAIVCLIGFTLILNGTGSYIIPAYREGVDVKYDCEKLSQEFEQLMPYSEDKWENTIAGYPLNDNFQLIYCRPAYIMSNACTYDFMKESLMNHTLKSRYVFIKKSKVDLDMYIALAQWGTLIWDDYEYTIYKRY